MFERDQDFSRVKIVKPRNTDKQVRCEFKGIHGFEEQDRTDSTE